MVPQDRKGRFGVRGFQEAETVAVAGMFHNKVQIADPDEQYGAEVLPLGLLDNFVDGVPVKNYVF